jgi:hypothetical protein
MEGPKKRKRFFEKYLGSKVHSDKKIIYNLENQLNLDKNINIQYQYLNSKYDLLVIKFISPPSKINISAKKFILNNGLLNLPYEIVNHISKFMCIEYYCTLFIQLSYTIRYPYESPVWKLLDLKTNLKKNINEIIGIYNYWIDIHNNMYEINYNWSGVITIDKDILYFIKKVNFFDELCD